MLQDTTIVANLYHIRATIFNLFLWCGLSRAVAGKKGCPAGRVAITWPERSGGRLTARNGGYYPQAKRRPGWRLKPGTTEENKNTKKLHKKDTSKLQKL